MQALLLIFVLIATVNSVASFAVPRAMTKVNMMKLADGVGYPSEGSEIMDDSQESNPKLFSMNRIVRLGRSRDEVSGNKYLQ